LPSLALDVDLPEDLAIIAARFHGHCHRKALGGIRADVALLEAAGIEVHAPDTGCCGMAGAFGFRRETYDASVRIADLALLPAVRAAAPATLIVADGFSCREQIETLSGRATLHLAEVLARALPSVTRRLPAFA